MGDRVIALAQELDDPTAEAIAHFFNAGQFWVGHLDEATRHARRLPRPGGAHAVAVRHRQRALCAQAMIAITRGDWDEALATIEWGLRAGRPIERLLACSAAHRAIMRGNTEVARELPAAARRAVAEHSAGPTVEYAQLAMLAARAHGSPDGDVRCDSAKRAAQAVVASPVPASAMFKVQVDIALCTGCPRHERRSAAAERTPAHSRRRTATRVPACLRRITSAASSSKRSTALDEAIDADRGGARLARRRLRPHRAEAAYDCARIRLERDAPGDRERARALIDEALGRRAGARHEAAGREDRGAQAARSRASARSRDIYTSIDDVADGVQTERPDIATHAAPDGTVTIMFSDIEDSTVLTERLGDQAWQELLRKHNALIREQLQAHGGYEVKTMGDGFMVAFQSAKKGARLRRSPSRRAFAERNRRARRAREGAHRPARRRGDQGRRRLLRQERDHGLARRRAGRRRRDPRVERDQSAADRLRHPVGRRAARSR